MNDRQRQQISDYIDEAREIGSLASSLRWGRKVSEFIKQALGFDAATLFEKLEDDNQYDEIAMRVGHLQGLIAKDDDHLTADARNSQGPGAQEEVLSAPNSRRVFIVHGHDGEAKESVARFIGKLGLDPVILHEQPNQGRTIIEKFEVSSGNVAFAVALLTPDDMGNSKSKLPELLPRARQNVILELGYFLGRLGRGRVCAIHKGGVELPSDYQGVLYIEFDPGGAWKAKLAQELVEAKLSINLQALIER